MTSLLEIIKAGTRVEESEFERKFALAMKVLKVDSKYTAWETGGNFLAFVIGAFELGLEPHIVYKNFYCPGSKTDSEHIVGSALVIENVPRCPIHTLKVKEPTTHQAIVHVRNQFD